MPWSWDTIPTEMITSIGAKCDREDLKTLSATNSRALLSLMLSEFVYPPRTKSMNETSCSDRPTSGTVPNETPTSDEAEKISTLLFEHCGSIHSYTIRSVTELFPPPWFPYLRTLIFSTEGPFCEPSHPEYDPDDLRRELEDMLELCPAKELSMSLTFHSSDFSPREYKRTIMILPAARKMPNLTNILLHHQQRSGGDHVERAVMSIRQTRMQYSKLESTLEYATRDLPSIQESWNNPIHMYDPDGLTFRIVLLFDDHCVAPRVPYGFKTLTREEEEDLDSLPPQASVIVHLYARESNNSLIGSDDGREVKRLVRAPEFRHSTLIDYWPGISLCYSRGGE
ncbi:hypothetical protein BCR39DRAFT_596837 [Naematelia encephala]|uniref:Uncharacterized protein n=1 Tax=Naematelia encephala TaxID=71784 RepID=A0A1Y2BJR6_9TREE|nr:hypothetical protein BCR39DRAFT_596837 [Naematelia encephala]